MDLNYRPNPVKLHQLYVLVYMYIINAVLCRVVLKYLDPIEKSGHAITQEICWYILPHLHFKI